MLSLIVFFSACKAPDQQAVSISTNTNFIESLQQPLNKITAEDLFYQVFLSIPSQQRIYPTENYYYFTSNIRGVSLKGNIGLFQSLIHKGMINFAIKESTPDVFDDKDIFSRSKVMGSSDGLKIELRDELTVVLTYRDLKREFTLSKPKLTKTSEDSVAALQDESGYEFILNFNSAEKVFYYTIADTQLLIDNFLELNGKFLLGKRTGFVFYKLGNEKILIGVNARQIWNNTWYDGPFDQMPDNAIAAKEFDFLKYLKQAYPEKIFISEFGDIAENSRVAITPYLAYENMKELMDKFSDVAEKKQRLLKILKQFDRAE